MVQLQVQPCRREIPEEDVMSQDEIKEIIEEVMEQIEDEDIAENLDVTTRYMPDEESGPSGW